MAYPLDVIIKGTALNTQGFTADGAIAGLGLNTFGFLWPCDGIWSPAEDEMNTAWIDCVNPADTIENCID